MFYMKLFLFNFNDFSNCGLKLFGLVLSPRGGFKLKTTLFRGLKVNG